MKKIYVAGCGGMLGDAIYKTLQKNFILKCTDIDVNTDWLSFLDFNDYNSYLNDVEKFSPQYLLHLGALTDLEFCEKNINLTYKTNIMSVENACLIAKKLGISLIYISTAGIFDGKKDFYNDWDQPNPINIYGESKYQGEKIINSLLNEFYIFRAGWMMGGGVKKDKKFISKILKQIDSGKSSLNIVDDKLGTPTYTYDFAKNLEKVINTNYFGTYNMVCQGLTSRFEVAEEIIKYFNMKNKISLNKVDSSFFKKDFFAKRPFSEQLINYKLEMRNLNTMRDWKICINDYLKSYYED